jgi:F0F1-type ATP synthase assembly protein I
MDKKDSYFLQVKQIGILTAVPVILLVGPIVGYFIGNWIDHKFRFYPWGTVFFLFLGFLAAGREVWRLLKQVLKEQPK